MNPSTLHQKSTAASVITKLYAVLNLITQAIMFLLHCDGIVAFFGKKLTIYSSVKYISAFSSLSKTENLSLYFRAWLGMAIGILYIVLFIYMAKQLISSIFMLKNEVFQHVSALALCDDIFDLGKQIGKTFFVSTAFIVICSLIKNFNIQTNAYYIIILGFLNYITTRLLITLINVLLKQYNYKSLIKQFVYLTIFCTSVFILMYYSAKMSLLKNFFDLFSELLFVEEANVIISIIGSMLLSLTYAILAIIAVIIIRSANNHENLGARSTRRIAEIALGFSIATFVIKLVLSFDNGIDSDTITSIFKNWEDYLTLLCVSIAVCLSSGFKITFEKNEKTHQEYQEIGKIDSKGVLKISTDITKITANIYQDCSNITKIIIPENVLEIEKNAFYGCGGVTGIYCEANSRPAGWDMDWNHGCYATVHWGIKASSNSNGEAQ